MKAGDKVTTDSGVILEAKLQEDLCPCNGCSFYNEGTCMARARGVDDDCWTEKGKSLIFVKSEDNE